jgi:hypothetical protein
MGEEVAKIPYILVQNLNFGSFVFQDEEIISLNNLIDFGIEKIVMP